MKNNIVEYYENFITEKGDNVILSRAADQKDSKQLANINCIFGLLMADYAKIIEYVYTHVFPDREIVEKRINFLDNIGYCLDSPVYNTLVGHLKENIYRSMYKDEFFYHYLFKRYISQILPEASITTHKIDNRNIPDAWVKYQNDVYPVECKQKQFDDKALQQLHHYMKTYNCSKGFAVGQDYIAAPDPSIIFINNVTLEKIAKKEDKEKETRKEIVSL